MEFYTEIFLKTIVDDNQILSSYKMSQDPIASIKSIGIIVEKIYTLFVKDHTSVFEFSEELIRESIDTLYKNRKDYDRIVPFDLTKLLNSYMMILCKRHYLSCEDCQIKTKNSVVYRRNCDFCNKKMILTKIQDELYQKEFILRCNFIGRVNSDDLNNFSEIFYLDQEARRTILDKISDINKKRPKKFCIFDKKYSILVCLYEIKIRLIFDKTYK